MDRPIGNGPVDQIVNLCAECMGVLLIGWEVDTGIAGTGPVVPVVSAVSSRTRQPERMQPDSPAPHSMANSRLNTTSKLNVLPLLFVSM